MKKIIAVMEIISIYHHLLYSMNKRDKLVTVRFNTQEHADLLKLSGENALSISSYVRWIIKKAIPSLGTMQDRSSEVNLR